MNFCGNCGTQRDPSHQFCAHCGEAFNEQKKFTQIKKPFVFTPSEIDIQAHQNHFNYNDKISSVGKIIGFALFICCAAMGQIVSELSIDFNFPMPFSLIPGFIGSMFVFILLLNMDIHRNIARKIYRPTYQFSGWSLQDVYNTFESAKLKNGEHRCIYCGNNRLYRKGIYASDSCTVNCTKCKEFLYYD